VNAGNALGRAWGVVDAARFGGLRADQGVQGWVASWATEPRMPSLSTTMHSTHPPVTRGLIFAACRNLGQRRCCLTHDRANSCSPRVFRVPSHSVSLLLFALPLQFALPELVIESTMCYATKDCILRLYPIHHRSTFSTTGVQASIRVTYERGRTI
jgi:hypothetical protein